MSTVPTVLHACDLVPCQQDLEKEVERLGQTHDKLRAAESEIHTLKSFLTSKTAMVERRKKELVFTQPVYTYGHIHH